MGLIRDIITSVEVTNLLAGRGYDQQHSMAGTYALAGGSTNDVLVYTTASDEHVRMYNICMSVSAAANSHLGTFYVRTTNLAGIETNAIWNSNRNDYSVLDGMGFQNNLQFRLTKYGAAAICSLDLNFTDGFYVAGDRKIYIQWQVDAAAGINARYHMYFASKKKTY